MTLHRFLETSAIAATIAYTGLVGEPGRPRYALSVVAPTAGPNPADDQRKK